MNTYPGSRHKRSAIRYYIAWLSVVPLIVLLPAVCWGEGSPNQCFEGRILQVFTGTDECPKAQYIVLKGEFLLPPDDRIGVLVSGSEKENGETFADFRDLSMERRAAAGRILVGTRQAKLLFNVDVDVLAPKANLPVHRGWIGMKCDTWGGVSARVNYGESNATTLGAGKALEWAEDRYQIANPIPRNGRGQRGRLGRCVLELPKAGSGPKPAPDGTTDLQPVAPPPPTSSCLCSSVAPRSQPLSWLSVLPLLLLLRRTRWGRSVVG